MIVVDTHIVLWDALDPARLSRKAKTAINRADKSDGIVICDITLWEIAMLIDRERITVEVPYNEFMKLVLASRQYTVHPITPEIAQRSMDCLPPGYGDPADRLIAATALVAGIPLITADKGLRDAIVIRTIW